MIVNVKAVDGRHFVLEVQSEDTVAQLKRAIYAKGGPDPARQRIIFCGNVCGNDMTIAETGVMAESEFHLAIINSALTIDELNDKNKALERQLDALAAQLKVQQHDFETKQAEKQQRQTLFQQELDRAQQALKATQRELDDSFTQMAMQRAESADEIEKLRKAAGDATDEVASLRKLIEMLERDTTALQTRFSASVGEIAALKESLRQEKEQAAQSQALVRDSRAEISELKASMQQAEAKAFSQGRDTGVADAMLEAEVDKESLVEELARAKAEMRHMRKQMVAAVDRQRVADRRTDQVLAAAKCAELEARRNSAETEERAAAEAAKTAKAQADAQVAQDARHKAEAKCQQLQSQLAAMEARLSEAETRVAAAEKTAAATATKAPLDVDITNVELQGELAAVHQALLRSRKHGWHAPIMSTHSHLFQLFLSEMAPWHLTVSDCYYWDALWLHYLLLVIVWVLVPFSELQIRSGIPSQFPVQLSLMQWLALASLLQQKASTLYYCADYWRHLFGGRPIGYPTV